MPLKVLAATALVQGHLREQADVGPMATHVRGVATATVRLLGGS